MTEKEARFTTAKVASLIQVHPNTVVNWVKRGILKAFQTPGGHRRIEAIDLIQFLAEHEMPVPDALKEYQRRILIVDDDVDTQKMLEQLFSGKYQTYIASNGIEAMIAIGRTTPDVVMLDILLPGLTGIEVCRQIKRSMGKDAPLIIAITGDPTRKTEQEMRAGGSDAFFRKPLNLQELLTITEKLLDSKKSEK